MKKGMIGTLIVLGVLVLPFGVGLYNNTVDRVVGGNSQNVQREKFENGKSYVHGKIEDLMRFKRELDREDDEIERQALIIHMQDELAGFDLNKIDNDSLRNFAHDIMNGGIK